MPLPKCIVYACPVGDLAEQISACLQLTRSIFPSNPALLYPPHCSLTGFVEEETDMLPVHLRALDAALCRARPARPEPAIRVRRLCFDVRFHGLYLESAWAKALVADYATEVRGEPCGRNVRLKDGLHLSLAYQFPPEMDEPLRHIAEDMVDPRAAVRWELRFYERSTDGTWICRQSWPL